MRNQLDGPEDRRGAGRSGGLLFVIVLLFAAYLALQALAGALRFLSLGILLAAAVIGLVVVVRR